MKTGGIDSFIYCLKYVMPSFSAIPRPTHQTNVSDRILKKNVFD